MENTKELVPPLRYCEYCDKEYTEIRFEAHTRGKVHQKLIELVERIKNLKGWQ